MSETIPDSESPPPTSRTTRAPRSVGQLAKVVRAYANAKGLAEGRVRDWISYMALGGRLEATAQVRGDGRNFTVKGGIAMELRRRDVGARATQDLDLTYLGSETDVVRVLEEAIAEPYGRFTFRRSGTPREMTNVNTTRVEIAVQFDGTAWGTVAVDVTRREGHQAEMELVPAFDIESDFGIPGPDKLPCISARYHLAHKLHGMTKIPDDGSVNERVQDAIDALMFMQIVEDLAAAREACVDVFTTRQKHSWRPTFSPPDAWAERFQRLAEELELEVRDIASATTTLQGFIQDIDRAGPQ